MKSSALFHLTDKACNSCEDEICRDGKRAHKVEPICDREIVREEHDAEGDEHREIDEGLGSIELALHEEDIIARFSAEAAILAPEETVGDNAEGRDAEPRDHVTLLGALGGPRQS